ncbi:MAG TPA: hypothetical protein VJ201_03860 [Candidatus Babeliales bacterium]|nr:hypothetical protein [Candidatus Babeliales bacterium]
MTAGKFDIFNETEYSQAVFEKLKKIQHFQKLKSENCDEVVIFNVLEIPRSTFRPHEALNFETPMDYYRPHPSIIEL